MMSYEGHIAGLGDRVAGARAEERGDRARCSARPTASCASAARPPSPPCREVADAGVRQRRRHGRPRARRHRAGDDRGRPPARASTRRCCSTTTARFAPATRRALRAARLPPARAPASSPRSAAATSPPGRRRQGPPAAARTCPPGLALDPLEGAGEVQTPLRGAAADRLRVGDRVYFRHAKAGELCERFDRLLPRRGRRGSSTRCRPTAARARASCERASCHRRGVMSTRPTASDLDAARRRVALAARRLAAEGLVIGTAGNVSARVGRPAWRSRRPARVLAELERRAGRGRRPRRRARGRRARADLRARPAPRRLRALRRRRASSTRTRRWPPRCRCVLDELPCVHYQMLLLGGTVPRRALPHLRHARAGRGRARRARGPHRGADGQPRRDRLRRATSTRPSSTSLLLEWACTVYWRAAGDRRRRARSTRPSSRRWSTPRSRAATGRRRRPAMSDEMTRDRDGRARARRARAPGRGDPRGPGRRAGRGDPHHRRGLGRGHGADARQARRRGAQRRRDRHRRARRHAARRCSSATASTPRCWCAATTCRPRPACCRSARTATRPAFHVVGANATYGPDDVAWDAIAGGHPPAPRRARVHGRRGGGARSSRAPASTAW